MALSTVKNHIEKTKTIKGTNTLGYYEHMHPKKYKCKYCNEEFVVYAGQMIYQDKKFVFCNYNCRAKWRKENEINKN